MRDDYIGSKERTPNAISGADLADSKLRGSEIFNAP